MRIAIECGRGHVHDALYDEADEPLVYAHKWRAIHVGKRVYAYTRISGKTVYIHRLLLGLQPCGRGRQDVDHENRNGLDNRQSNIRVATRSQNITNGTGQARSTSGYKGVFPYGKTGRKWEACIGVNGRKIKVGIFTDPTEAAAAYDRAAVEHYGEFALTNAAIRVS
jgi:hypothetical protein